MGRSTGGMLRGFAQLEPQQRETKSYSKLTVTIILWMGLKLKWRGYGLLPGKSRDIYHQFFMGVKEEAMNNGQHISPEEIMTDFELTLVQSLELEFPGARIHGCYFHFAQCLWRKVQRLGLVEEYKEDEFIRRFIQKSAATGMSALSPSHGMDLKLTCQIIVRCRVMQIISMKPG